ncbi:MAG: FAD-binding and (Fe-S)-binding domain-containing protein [Bacteroidales bacterium]
MENKYQDYLKNISVYIPKSRIYTDALRTLAWGTDASFYRLIPKIVIQAQNQQEVALLLNEANKLLLPVTFRAAGTSLSGQSLSDSILIVAGKSWDRCEILEGGELIKSQPGVIGERINQLLKPYGRRFTPDPASVKSAMLGGIIMNNASGMNCSTHSNSDRMLESATIVLYDGTVLDTSSDISREEFLKLHPEIISKIISIRDQIKDDIELSGLIRRKYSIKNVTGLNLLPFILYDDPFDIITHLMVGSEGTLAFLSEATMRSGRDHLHKSSAMIYFSDLRSACAAIQRMKELPVISAELLDRRSLKAVEDRPGIPDFISSLADGVTAVLVEVIGDDQEEMQSNCELVRGELSRYSTVYPIEFTDDESIYSGYWAIRSGIFPSVGAMREPGTTCLIEDVAFPISHLPEATAELQDMLSRHGYDDAVIYGHAMDGNYHFIFSQSFSSEKEIERYERLMDDVVKLVVDKYQGSLKAEHGTGRNMAAYVSYEWGDKAFAIMREIKSLFDPNNIINPGVIFNDDPNCHTKNLKPLPLCNRSVDKCIECGFCEVNCLTHGLTLSSRQRIVAWREISKLKDEPSSTKRLSELKSSFKYYGEQTCAGDGLCATSCPMGINTGELIHEVRAIGIPKGSVAWSVGSFSAKHFRQVKSSLRALLRLASFSQSVVGDKALSSITYAGGAVIKGFPQWMPEMPSAYKFDKQQFSQATSLDKVVYFPSCINQTMGLSKGSVVKDSLVETTVRLLNRAGYEVIFPDNIDNYCCGTIWESKGMADIADMKSQELFNALWKASNNGQYPILCDQSPCLYRMRNVMKGLNLFEPVEFIHKFLLNRLTIKRDNRSISVHATCSSRKMGHTNMLIDIAKRCSSNLFVPQEVGCCGFAGDKGFTNPEINSYALRKLKPQLLENSVEIGFSNSRTCEIGLEHNTGIPYLSIIYLLDQCSDSSFDSSNI